MTFGLPTAVEIGGTEYQIRTDFRDILGIITALNDAELSNRERAYVALLIFYPDLESIPVSCYEEALKKCYWFINGGQEDDTGGRKPVLMSWEQDYPYIIAPVNRVLGHDARSDRYLHWWTFLAAYMEIGDCTFAQIVHVRSSQKKGKPLDKWDREWYRENRKLVDMKTNLSGDELEELKKWGG